jgi:hypothetical protein
VTPVTAAAPHSPENGLNEHGEPFMRKFLAVGLIALAALGSASAAEAPVRPQQSHARSVAQVSGPAHWCYCG